jgi:hypothetical protein
VSQKYVVCVEYLRNILWVCRVSQKYVVSVEYLRNMLCVSSISEICCVECLRNMLFVRVRVSQKYFVSVLSVSSQKDMLFRHSVTTVFISNKDMMIVCYTAI